MGNAIPPGIYIRPDLGVFPLALNDMDVLNEYTFKLKSWYHEIKTYFIMIWYHYLIATTVIGTCISLAAIRVAM